MISFYKIYNIALDKKSELKHQLDILQIQLQQCFYVFLNNRIQMNTNDGNPHRKLLNTIWNNTRFRNIQVKQISFVQAFFITKDFNKCNQYECFICLDMYSLLKQYIKITPGLKEQIQCSASQNKNIKNSNQFRQNYQKYENQMDQQQKLYENNSYHLRNHINIISTIIGYFYTLYYFIQDFTKSGQFIIVFPQNQQYFINKSVFPVSKIINNLLNLKCEYQIEISQQPQDQQTHYYEKIWCQSIFDALQITQLYQTIPYQLTQEKAQLLLQTVKKLKVPWLNKKQFVGNPCERQLAHYSQLGYICLTWNAQSLNYVPLGIYIIGMNLQILSKIHHQRTNPQQTQKTAEDQFIKSQLIYYYKTSHFNFDCQKFQTSQLNIQVFITVLTNFSPYININMKAIRQIKFGCYDTAKWILKKILTFYLLLQLHPIRNTTSYQNSIQNSKGFIGQIKIIYERQLQNFTPYQLKTIIQGNNGKVIFIHKQLQPFLNMCIPQKMIKNQFKYRSKDYSQLESTTISKQKEKVQINNPNMNEIRRNLFHNYNEQQIQQAQSQKYTNSQNTKKISFLKQEKPKKLSSQYKTNKNNKNIYIELTKIKINEVQQNCSPHEESDIDD